jgi:23S rRNA pseudouridine2605 synthase
MIRLQKHMANSGVASRRASEKLIEEGRVKVNGVVVTQLGTPVNPEIDQVEVDGKLIHTVSE